MTVHVTTRVLPGNRIEVTAAGLREGEDVDVTIRPVAERPSQRASGILDYLDSLPPGKKTAQEWVEFDKEFQQERDSWDR